MRDDVLDAAAAGPRHVVGFLFDGANPNVLYAMAAAGEAPNVARLIEMGTAFGHGAMAGLPTVTLANHTSILTGAYPGHHGILNNAWYDRAAGRQVITNSSATWPTAMDHIRPGTETIHSAVRRTWPDDVHGVGQRALRRRRRLLHVRLLPPRRGPADPRTRRRPAPRHRAVRAPVEGLLVVVGRRPHGHRAGRRHLVGATTATSRTQCPASCGSTSRSPTRRCTRAAPIRRWPRHRSATATPASARCSRPSSGPASSTTPRSSSWPTTAWRRTTRRAGATGTSTSRAAGIDVRDEAYGFLYFGVGRHRRRARDTRRGTMRKVVSLLAVGALALAACGSSKSSGSASDSNSPTTKSVRAGRRPRPRAAATTSSHRCSTRSTPRPTRSRTRTAATRSRSRNGHPTSATRRPTRRSTRAATRR